MDRELDVHRRFERVTSQFPVALSSVAIAEEKERARHIDRQVNGSSFADLVVVEITTITAEKTCGTSHVPWRGHSNAPEYGLQRNCVVCQTRTRILQLRDAFVAIKHPAGFK